MTRAETLYALLDPKSYDKKAFTNTWQKILLYDEHTWGSWNSISEPEADFTKQQWKVKQSFAIDGANESEHLINKVLENRENKSSSNSFEVFNSLSWKRSGMVYLSGDIKANSVQDTEGKKYPLQKLADGLTVLLAEDIPAFGSKVYYFKDEKILDKFPSKLEDYTLKSDMITIGIDLKTGAIKKLIINEINIADTSKINGLNDYFYITGRNPKNKSGIENVKVSLKEDGPIISSLFIESKAPGCKSISREIQFIKPLGIVKIINTIDKEKVYNPEGLHFAFPFYVPNGQIHYNLAFSVPRVEDDQMPGSCRNYLTMENYLDVSNYKYGVTLVSLDAPLFEVGDIMTDAKAYGWVDRLNQSQTIYSYIMNNYWETNYCAYQEGKTRFVYLIKPHGRFNSLDAEKFSTEQSQALIPIINSDKQFIPDFELDDNGIIAISLKPVNQGLLMTLYNPSGKPEILKWIKEPKSIFKSNFDGDKLNPLNDEIKIPAYGLFNLYLPQI
jgi:alpha-mannosidase